MSFRWVKGAAATVAAGGILVLALAGHFGWLGDSDPGPVEARLLTEGKVGDERWAVVLVTSDKGEKRHLRNRGVDVALANLGVEQILDRQHRRLVPGQYQIELVTLPRTAQPLFFGVLPAGAVRAEALLLGARKKATAIPINIRASDGTAVPYVIEPAPGSPETWRAVSAVTIHVYDANGRQLLPKK